jgi:transcriptional regulator with XRE-family HTH domain
VRRPVEGFVTNFSENLEWLRRRAGLNQTQFASEFGIERSYFNRLLSGEREPTAAQMLAIGNLYNLEPNDLLLPHLEFVERFSTANSNLPLASFRTIRSNAPRLRSVFESYRGQYIVYNLRTSGQAADRFNASLLDIKRLSGDAIQFEFINPTRLITDEMTAFEYSGYAFPVGNTLYLLGEQRDHEYEILSMLIQMSQAASIQILKGLFTAIGIKNENKVEKSLIIARSIVLVRRRRRLENWRSAIGTELGFLPESKLPTIVRYALVNQNIDIE